MTLRFFFIYCLGIRHIAFDSQTSSIAPERLVGKGITLDFEIHFCIINSLPGIQTQSKTKAFLSSDFFHMKRFLTFVFLLALTGEFVFLAVVREVNQTEQKIRLTRLSDISAVPPPSEKILPDQKNGSPDIRSVAFETDSLKTSDSYPKIRSAAPVVVPSVLRGAKRTFTNRDFARNFDRMVRESTVVSGAEKKEESDRVKTLLYKTSQQLPPSHQKALQYFMLHLDYNETRGLAGQNTMILHTGTLPDREIEAVYIHEMGHVVDTGLFLGSNDAFPSNFSDGKTQVFSNDPSVSFYSISWKSNQEQHQGSTKRDFVSGYAMSDPFEDFAESYVFYVLSGRTFRTMLPSSPKLEQKYKFLQEIVFQGREFDTGVPASDTETRVYDATKITS